MGPWHRTALWCLKGIYSFSFWPHSLTRLSLAPPGEKEEPTAIYGRVFKAKKYSLEMHVDISDP